jgi:hypothetical protein
MNQPTEQTLNQPTEQIPSLDEKIDRLLLIEDKIDAVLELQIQAQSRARWGMFWKFFWIFILFILPMYFSYKFMSSLDISSMKDALESLKAILGKSSSVNTNTSLDMNSLLELLDK